MIHSCSFIEKFELVNNLIQTVHSNNLTDKEELCCYGAKMSHITPLTGILNEQEVL